MRDTCAGLSSPHEGDQMPKLWGRDRRSPARRKKDANRVDHRQRDGSGLTDPGDRNRWSNRLTDGGIDLPVCEDGNRTMVIGFSGVDMDPFVQRRRGRHQINQPDQDDDRRRQQTFGRLCQRPSSLLQLYCNTTKPVARTQAFSDWPTGSSGRSPRTVIPHHFRRRRRCRFWQAGQRPKNSKLWLISV